MAGLAEMDWCSRAPPLLAHATVLLWKALDPRYIDEAQWIVEPSTMLFRNKCSPYQGKTMTGQVRETWLRGQRVFARGGTNGGFVGKTCSGQLLLEPSTKEIKRVKSWFERWVYDFGD